jgi:hypothetical protein
MRFDSLQSVRDFVGEDYEQAYVPDKARAVLLRFDERSQHYDLRETLHYYCLDGTDLKTGTGNVGDQEPTR